MKTKRIVYYTYVNWRTDEVKVRKTRRKKPNPYEVVTRINLEIKVPDRIRDVISQNVEIGEGELLEHYMDHIGIDDFEKYEEDK